MAPLTGLTGKPAFAKFISLFYAEGEEIHLKTGHCDFHFGSVTHDGDFGLFHTKGKGTDRRVTGKTSSAFNYLNYTANNFDGGVFFIPGKPSKFPLKDCCIASDILSAELDDGTADEQWERIQEFIDISGLTLTAILTSGGKSYHIHCKLNRPLSIADRTYLMRLFAIALDSDPAVTSPHQPMRIPGFLRKEKGNYQALIHVDDTAIFTPAQWVEGLKKVFAVKGLEFPETISDEQWRKYKAFRRDGAFTPERWTNQILHPPAAPIRSRKPTTYKYDGSTIPLEHFLTKDDQQLLANGTGEGNRDNAAIKLAKNLIATESRLPALGIHYSGDAEALFDEFCSRCNPSLPDRDRQRIWRSAHRGNPTPTLSDEQLLERAKWYGWEDRKFSGGEQDRNFTEPDPREYAQYLARSEEWERIINAQEIEHKTKKLGNLFSKISNKVKKVSQKFGFGQKTEIKITEKPLHPQIEIEEYDLNDRQKVWEQKYAEGKKYIFDLSGTGSFKSHTAGEINPVRFGLNHALYIHKDYRNTTVETLSSDNGWTTVDGRNPGLKQDALGKWRVVKPGEAYAVPGNCTRTQTINAIRSYGIKNADNSDLACKGCNNYEICRAASTDSVGYLNQRATKLNMKNGEQKKLIMHPASLPDTIPKINAEGEEICFPHSETIKIWEESSDSFTNEESIDVTLNDVEKLTTHLLLYPELLNSLSPVLCKLKDLLDGTIKQPNLHGWSHNRLIEIIPNVNVDIVALIEATTPDLTLLNTIEEYGEDITNLPRNLRKKFNKNDSETAENVKQNLLKQWIIPFLDILARKPGTISIKNRKLTITYPDQYLVNQAKSAGLNIFLDATPDLKSMVAMLGVDISECAFIKAKTAPTNNIEIIQVSEMGRLGMSRGEHQQKQVALVMSELEKFHENLLKFRFKKYSQPGDLIHWTNSKGFNDGKNAIALAIEGLACENIESLKAKFACIYGYVPTDETVKRKFPVNVQAVSVDGELQPVPDGQSVEIELEVSADPKFADFVHRRILATLHQEIGRLRANLRPDEQLTVYILGEYPLDLPVTLVPAGDIHPDAAPKGKSTINAVKRAIATLADQGLKATGKAIAEVVGCSQQNVSKILSKINQLTQWSFTTFACKDSNSKSSKNPDSDDGVTQELARDYMPVIASCSADELLAELEAFFDNERDWWKSIWQQTAPSVQVEILTKLLSMLPSDYLTPLSEYLT